MDFAGSSRTAKNRTRWKCMCILKGQNKLLGEQILSFKG